VKFLFLSILLANIVFFFWEYRKGAPNIYYPSSVVNSHFSTELQIFLLSELPPKPLPLKEIVSSNKSIQINFDQVFVGPIKPINVFAEFVGPVLPKYKGRASKVIAEQAFVGPRQLNASNETFVGPVLSKYKDTAVKVISEQVFVGPRPLNAPNEVFVGPLLLSNKDSIVTSEARHEALTEEVLEEIDELLKITCYSLKEQAYTKNMLIVNNKSENFNASFKQIEQQYISSYLVLTDAASSYLDAKVQKKAIKQKGINELWLFRKGVFSRRISLGLFKSENKAEKAQKYFKKKLGINLEVVPSYQTRLLTEVTVNGLEKDIELFEAEFSQYINIGECSEE